MLRLEVRLRFGVFDAGSVEDPARTEWPPHPARVFCALVASGPDADEWEALQWLESQEPPEVWAPPALHELANEQFLVTNRLEPGGGSQFHPGRTQLSRIKPRLVPDGDRFAVVWPDAVPTDVVLAALRSLAARVPYVGRATSDAEVLVDTDGADATGEVYEPVALHEGELDLRVPYQGYCDGLREAHEHGWRAWEASRRVAYRRRRPPGPSAPSVARSPFGSLLTFGIRGRSSLGGSQVGRVADQLRRATMRIVEDRLGQVPPTVSGHGADGRAHVAYLALPNVGSPARLPDGPVIERRNPEADGRVLAVALAIPGDDVDLAAELHAALTGASGLDHLTLGAEGVIELTHDQHLTTPWGATHRRWEGPATLWATATPVVLDRFPRPGRDDLGQLVADAIVTAGFPAPVQAVACHAPLLPGSSTLGRSSVQRRAGVPSRPWVHAWVRFGQPVRGPVLAGSSRYRGLGLFAPLRAREPGGEAT